MRMTSYDPGYLWGTICTMARYARRRQRRLWRPLDEPTPLSPSSSSSLSNGDCHSYHERETALGTYETLRRQFVVVPPLSSLNTTALATPYWRSWPRLCANAVVVVQEFALSSWLLARHRLVQKERKYPEFLVSASTWLLLVAMVITIVYSTAAAAAAAAAADGANDPPQSRGAKARQRTLDAVLVAVLLRFTAQVLPSLTASYSTDTVERLAGLGLLVHLLFCDYSYANGRPAACGRPQSPTLYSAAPHGDTTGTSTVARYQSRRPSFQGGTASLNAVFFTTTLLVSRCSESDDNHANTAIGTCVVLFGFYPAARHAVSARFPSHQSGTLAFSRDSCVGLELSHKLCCQRVAPHP
jgi:Phosphatidylinositol N-acetylglucosaminyltransferase